MGLMIMLAAGCGSDNKAEPQPASDIKQLVAQYSTGELKAERASITSRELIVTGADQSKKTYRLPEDEFFLSIAPYVDGTHPCEIHNLTSCRGEIADEPFEIHIQDTEGNTVLNEAVNSQANGFIDLWLPRDRTYQVTITHASGTAEQEISTFENDFTCITTMQLQPNSTI